MKKLLLNFVALMGVFLFLGTGSAKATTYLRWEAPGINNWGSNDFVFNGNGNTRTLHLDELPADTKFKIYDNGDGEKWFGSEFILSLGSEFDAWTNNNNNINLSQGRLTDVDIKFEGIGNWSSCKITVMGTPYVYIHGNWGTGESWNNFDSAIELNQVSPGVWRGVLTTNNDGDNYFRFKYGDDEFGPASTGADTPVKIGSEVTVGSKTNKEKCYTIQGKGTYIVTLTMPSLSSDMPTFKIEDKPENLYLYGHVKGDSWDETDYYSAKNEDGIYKFTDVNISGNKDEVNQNYIAFFSYMDTDNDSELDFEAMLPRYGGDESQAGGNNNGGSNIVFLESDFTQDNEYTVEKKIVCYGKNSDPGQEHNFRLPNGMYDIVVDLNKNTISVTKPNFQYKWHDADGKEISSDTHEMTYGVNNKIQISAKDDLNHEAANKAIFKVEYEALSTVRGVKAYASTDVTGNNEYYETGNDYVLTLNKAGTYTVTASLPEDLQSEYYGLEPISLTATVAKAPVTVIAEDFEKNFDPTNNVYQPGISFSQAVEESDFTITIAPANNAEGWVKLTDYQTDGSSVEDAYKLALSDDIFSHQYQQLTAEYIDGFYSPLQSYTLSGEGTDYTVSQAFPCSGIYNMTIQEAENGNITFDDKTVTITIKPNLGVMFGNVSGFNINGYGFTEDDTEDILYATSQATETLLKKSVAYKPGTYFDSSFTITFNGNTYPSTNTVAESQKAQNTDWINFDFSDLVDNNSIPVTANVVKNGASSESFNFLVSKATTTPTAVDTIEAAEDGEAVYYNRQGVKVENPQHGIYVKVVNGKAQKVVL